MLDENGHEMLDDTPIEVPVRLKRPETLQEQIRRFFRSEEINQAIENAGFETFEEADDFEVDDYEPRSPHEQNINQEIEGINNDQDALFQQYNEQRKPPPEKKPPTGTGETPPTGIQPSGETPPQSAEGNPGNKPKAG